MNAKREMMEEGGGGGRRRGECGKQIKKQKN